MTGPWKRRCMAAGMLAGITAGAPAAAANGPAPEPLLEFGPVALLDSGEDILTIGLGAYEAVDQNTSFAGSLEYRFGRKLFGIGPALGLIANVDGGLYGYFALYADLAIGPLVITPALGVGGSRTGESVDLGGTFAFREQLEVAWRFAQGYRLGVRIGHISNANIYEANPGEEDVMVTFGLPLGPVF